MSNQDYSNQPLEDHRFGTNNPWAHPDEQNTASTHGQGTHQQELQDAFTDTSQQQQQNPFGDTSQQHQQEGFSAPSGPPPGQAPARSATFKETDFIPESERGEQREAMQQFELNKSDESQHDKDVAQLQQEYPSVDGSLIAAIYGDSGMGAARETLQELASQT